MGKLIELQERNGEAQDRRVAKAIAVEADLVWTQTPHGWLVRTPSGGCYLVTVGKTCACGCRDFEKRCAGSELRC